MSNNSHLTNDPVSFLASKIAKGGNTQEKNSFTVVKRNGSMVPFRRERIFKAIEAAFRDTKKVSKLDTLPEELSLTIDQVTDQVVEQILSLASKGACLTV